MEGHNYPRGFIYLGEAPRLLRDEHRIQCSTTQQLVAADEEVEAVFSKHVVAADAADLDVVVARGRDGHRVEARVRVVGDGEAREAREGLAGGLGRDGLDGLDGDGLGVRAERRDADGGARVLEIVELELGSAVD